MRDLQKPVHGEPEVEDVPAVRHREAVSSEADSMTDVGKGIVPTFLVPPHVLRAMEADIERAEQSALPGQRLVRAPFVIAYVKQLVKACRHGK